MSPCAAFTARLKVQFQLNDAGFLCTEVVLLRFKEVLDEGEHEGGGCGGGGSDGGGGLAADSPDERS